MSKHAKIVHTVETTVDAVGKEAAAELFQHISAQAQKLVSQPSDLRMSQKEWEDLYLPATLGKLFHHLARAFDEGSDGWLQVFWSNLHEKYDDDN